MNSKRFISGLAVALIASSAALLSGCLAEGASADMPESDAAPSAEEPVGEAAQAIGTECAAAAATATFVNTINYTSPWTYSTPSCYKAVVLDVVNYASSMPAGYNTAAIKVDWADLAPTTVDLSNYTLCADLWMEIDLFESVNGSWVFRTSREAFGSAPNFPAPGTCVTPEIHLSDLMLPGHTYRVAATARPSKSSTVSTRRLSVSTWFWQNPH